MLAAACGSAPATFDVVGKVGGQADEVHNSGTCRFGDAWYHRGDDIVLWGADNTVLATDQLVKGPATRPGTDGVCDLTFHFGDVRPGDVGYQLTVGASRRIVITEAQLRANGFELIPRAHGNVDDPDIQVTAVPSSSSQSKS